MVGSVADAAGGVCDFLLMPVRRVTRAWIMRRMEGV